MSNELSQFIFPDNYQLEQMGKSERLIVFRRYFAHSRYNRLVLQLTLIRSIFDETLRSNIVSLANLHIQDFFDTIDMLKNQGWMNEFLNAAKDEESALEKIIEAYDKRMNLPN